MTDAEKGSPAERAEILTQALPHMLRYDDTIVVVKYGGHAMGDEATARRFARDMVMLEQSGVNKQIVGFINAEGGRAIGLCGKDGNMVTATKLELTGELGDPDGDHGIDLGFVGEPSRVDTTVLDQVLGRELIPVLAPVAQGADGATYNVNADTFAGAIAGALKAKRLLLLTDVPGVLDKDKTLIKELSVDAIRELIADGTITGGMIPKVETCIYALEQGVEGVVILDGKVPHSVLLELLTDHGAGTLITR